MQNMNDQEARKALFNRYYNLEQEVIQAKELQKELKNEFTYDKEFCVNGLTKDAVRDITKAAQAKARQDNLKEKAEELLAVHELISELEG